MKPRERFEAFRSWKDSPKWEVYDHGKREVIARNLTREQAESRAKLENHPNDRAAIERLAGDIDKAKGTE